MHSITFYYQFNEYTLIKQLIFHWPMFDIALHATLVKNELRIILQCLNYELQCKLKHFTQTCSVNYVIHLLNDTYQA